MFHLPTAGEDRLQAWAVATGEPAFAWGAPGCRYAWAAGLQRAFARWANAHPAPLTIYHDGFGADLLSPLDTATHKVLLPHLWGPRWRTVLAWQLRCTGKLIVHSAAAADALQTAFGWIPQRFIQVVSEPALTLTAPAPTVRSAPPAASTAGPLAGIWLQGRSWRLFGDRLRALLDRWTTQAGTLQIVCSGPAVPRWGRCAGVDWVQGASLADALPLLRSWQAAILFQDFDLSAPWLNLALQQGAYVIRPEGEHPDAAGLWAEDGAPTPVPWGDVAAILARLSEVRPLSEPQQRSYRAWTAQVIAGSCPEAFRTSYHAACVQLLAQRPVRLRPRPSISLQPMAWYRLLHRLRSGMAG